MIRILEIKLKRPRSGQTFVKETDENNYIDAEGIEEKRCCL